MFRSLDAMALGIAPEQAARLCDAVHHDLEIEAGRHGHRQACLPP
jgi:hypothetical protein